MIMATKQVLTPSPTGAHSKQVVRQGQIAERHYASLFYAKRDNISEFSFNGGEKDAVDPKNELLSSTSTQSRHRESPGT